MRLRTHPERTTTSQERAVHHTDTDLPNCPGHHTEDTPGNPVWCHDHAARIHTALTGLPAAYRALASTEALDTGRRQILRAPSPEPASPSRRMDHADVILHDLCQWEDAVRQYSGDRPSRYPVTHDGRALHGAVTYLTHRHIAALASPFAIDYGNEILALAHTANALLGRHADDSKPARIRVEGLCPDCGSTTMYQAEGIDAVRCQAAGCPLDITYDEYLAMLEWDAQAYQGAA
jgi:hypothetical protein